MNTYLSDLIARMSDDNYRPDTEKVEGTWSSDKTVSWEAYDEARKLDKLQFLDDLYTVVEGKAEKLFKHHAYFIITQITKNTGDLAATGYLLEKLLKEKNIDTLSFTLSTLGYIYKPLSLDIEPIFNKAEHRNSSVRGSAYLGLTNSERPVEPFLREKLKNMEYTDDILWLLSALKFVGTEKTLSIIEPRLKSRNFEIKERAYETMSIIMLKNEHSPTAISDKLKLPATGVINFQIDQVRGLERNLSYYVRKG